MSKFKQAVAEALSLPPEDLDELAVQISEFVHARTADFHLTEEQAEEVRQILEAVDNGTMPTYDLEEMQEFWVTLTRER